MMRRASRRLQRVLLKGLAAMMRAAGSALWALARGLEWIGRRV
jgi:hypothetical protein